MIKQSKTKVTTPADNAIDHAEEKIASLRSILRSMTYNEFEACGVEFDTAFGIENVAVTMGAVAGFMNAR